ncbi:protein kilB [Streptomyces cyaneofuscatus]|uniref:protein kilB n=1 Tax=Streptomyces cyaneofuscatus TaxID=66883 RepID=UPI00343E3D79
MLTAVVAVVGTLAGSLLTGVLQHVLQRAQRVSAEASARRMEGLDAVAALASALADHRRAMSVREEIRLAGGDWSAARTESHLTRSAITGPLLRVQLLLPGLAPAAQSAAQAAYGMREAGTAAELQEAREHAIQASDALVGAAAVTLAA